MKYKKIVMYCLVLISIMFLFSSQNLFSQQRYEGEIALGITGIGDQVQWYYEWVAISNPRWWNDYCLTNNYYYDRTPTFTGSYIEPVYAYSSPSSAGYDNIAWGHYRFTFHIPDESFSKSFYLDLRDANWSIIQPPYPSGPDTKFRWNHYIQKFEFKNDVYTSWTSFSAGSNKTIWSLFNISEPFQECFQPTPPYYFECTNPYSIGQCPNFHWYAPFAPEGVEFKYKIYRKEGGGSFICVASNISSTSWTDQTVTIGSYGTWFIYKATAYLTNSPESTPSELAMIRANPHKAKHGEYNDSDIVTESGLNYKLSTFPNPFNPTTKISYTITEPTQTQISIISIMGQEIAELVNEYKYPGEYTTNFNGQSLAGGIYLVRLLTKDRQVTQKILLLK